MYSVRRLRDIRELDLFLFGGVHETAEQIYERDTYGHSEIRTTRQPIYTSQPPNGAFSGFSIGYVEIDLTTGEFATYDVTGTKDHPLPLPSQGSEE